MRMRRFWITTASLLTTNPRIRSLQNRQFSKSFVFARAFSASNDNDMAVAACVSRRSDNLNSHLERLKSSPTALLFLDGGTGEELFRRGVPDDRKIWSATAVVNEKYHKTLQSVHRSFIDSGSNAITTNSYGITPGVGFSRKDMIKYVALAGELARKSLDEGDDSIVLGSLGPVVESYRPDLVSEHKDGVETYKHMAAALAPTVDCFLAETMSSVEESSQAMEAVGSLSDGLKRPIMVSWTLNSAGKIRSGEAVTDAIIALVDYAGKVSVDLVGILFNCAEPEAITKALNEIQSNDSVRNILRSKSIHLGAYANRLTPIPDRWSLESSEEAQAMRDDLSPSEYFNDFVNIWVKDLGLKMIGGCCGITPEHIKYMTTHLRTEKS